MSTSFSNQAESIAHLAARLTDVALETLGGTGNRRDSVATELNLWHTLRAELEEGRCADRARAQFYRV